MTDTIRLNVNVPRDLHEAFAKVAATNERSVSAHLRWLMRCAVLRPPTPEGGAK